MIKQQDISLIIFNMQLELIPLLHNSYQLTHDCRWLADLFQTLQLPTALTEHKKLGKLAPSICKLAPQATILNKYYFNMTRETQILDYVNQLNRNQIVLAGAESHVCLFQSAVALKQLGKQVFILRDSISARSVDDNAAAIQRLQHHNIELITKEMLFFELLEHSEQSNYLDLAMKFLDGRYIE